jgi:hypothetical protein
VQTTAPRPRLLSSQRLEVYQRVLNNLLYINVHYRGLSRTLLDYMPIFCGFTFDLKSPCTTRHRQLELLIDQISNSSHQQRSKTSQRSRESTLSQRFLTTSSIPQAHLCRAFEEPYKSKRVVTTSPMIKRLFGGFSYSAIMSTDDITSNSQRYQINISLPQIM